jgi:hypothetical protein
MPRSRLPAWGDRVESYRPEIIGIAAALGREVFFIKSTLNQKNIAT